MVEGHKSKQAAGGLLPTAAGVISVLTSPFLVTAVCVVLLVLQLEPSPSELLLWAAICVVCGAALPLLFVYHLWRRGHVGDMHVAVREQRAGPFAATLLGGAVGAALLYAVQAPAQLVALGCVYVAVGLVLALTTVWWKISVHVAVYVACLVAVALGGWTVALYALLGVPPVIWARTYRGRHTLQQGLMGALLGLSVTPLSYWVALALLPGA